jgi:integrase
MTTTSGGDRHREPNAGTLVADFIFWGRVHDHRNHTGMRECFVNLLQRAGIEDFTFHDLRHTFASHLAMAGVPLHTIGQLLGHKRPEMTMRYAHLAPGYLKTAVNSLPVWGTRTKLAQTAEREA